jgi:hypothetical protein
MEADKQWRAQRRRTAAVYRAILKGIADYHNSTLPPMVCLIDDYLGDLKLTNANLRLIRLASAIAVYQAENDVGGRGALAAYDRQEDGRRAARARAFDGDEMAQSEAYNLIRSTWDERIKSAHSEEALARQIQRILVDAGLVNKSKKPMTTRNIKRVAKREVGGGYFPDGF